MNGTRMLNKMDVDLQQWTAPAVLNISALLGPGLSLPDFDVQAEFDNRYNGLLG